MELPYYRNGNVKGVVNDTAVNAQKHDACTQTHKRIEYIWKKLLALKVTL